MGDYQPFENPSYDGPGEPLLRLNDKHLDLYKPDWCFEKFTYHYNQVETLNKMPDQHF